MSVKMPTDGDPTAVLIMLLVLLLGIFCIGFIFGAVVQYIHGCHL